MQRKGISILFSLVLLSSCNYFQNVALLTEGRVKEKQFREEFPFTFESGLLVLQVQVSDDPNRHSFIFDTGAFNSKINAELAGALGLPVKATKSNSDSQGNEQLIEVVQIDSLQLGDLTFLNIGAGKLNWDSLSATPCVADGGIIGANLIKLANWQVDFENQTITVSDQPFEVASDAIRIPFTHPLLSGTPEISLPVQDRKARPILIDLGSNGGLRLPYSLRDAFTSTETLHLADRTNSGIYGVNADSLMIKSLPIELGETTIDWPVRFEGSGEGLLGNEILQHYRVTLNYKGNVAYLEPYAGMPAPDRTLRFIPGYLTEDLWVVSRAEIGSAFALGDTLRSVNGLSPGEVFPTYCEFFFGIGEFLASEPSLRVETMDGEIVEVNPFWGE